MQATLAKIETQLNDSFSLRCVKKTEYEFTKSEINKESNVNLILKVFSDGKLHIPF